MDQLFARFHHLVSRTDLGFIRYLYSQINWDNRLIGIVGSRGVGKTTLLFQRIKQNYNVDSGEVLYASLDNIWFTTHSLLDLADDFHNNGGKALFLDEVHKYPNWSREIKNIYDSYPEMKIVFTGSSMLDIHKSGADLSRRAIRYTLYGLSFREYLEFEYGYKMDAVSFDELLKNHVGLAGGIIKSVKPIVAFKDYIRSGYYPFYKEDREGYYQRVQETVNAILEIDLPSVMDIEFATILKIKKLFSIIATLVPFTPNISQLASQVEVGRASLLKYINALDDAHAVLTLDKEAKGLKQLVKPEKIYLGNTNYAYAFAGEGVDIGNVRETFFYSLVAATNSVTYLDKTDFLVDGKYSFEVGGKDKTTSQIQGLPNSYLAKDNIEIGYNNQIPLWMFGLLY